MNQELLKTIKDKRTAWQAFRFGVTGGKVTNVRGARELRQTIARALTQLKQDHGKQK